MSNNIYPDLTNTKFDVKYSKRKMLSSDMLRNRTGAIVGVGGGSGDVTVVEDDPSADGINIYNSDGVLTGNRTLDVDVFNLNILNLPEEITGETLYYDHITGQLSYGAAPTGINIYNSDGVLTNPREVDANFNDFYIINNSYFYVEANDLVSESWMQISAGIVYLRSDNGLGNNSSLQIQPNEVVIYAGAFGSAVFRVDNIANTVTSEVLYYNHSTGNITYGAAGGGGGGVTTMAAIGAVPNANGASISGSTLTLQPASSSFGGVLTTGSQEIAGNKTFTNILQWKAGVGTFLGTLGSVSVGIDYYGAIHLKNSVNSFYSYLYTDVLTANRDIKLPNANGIVTLNENPNYAAGTQTNGYVITLVAGVPTWAVAGGGGGTTYTSDEGITLTSTNFQLGSTSNSGVPLSTSRYINTGANALRVRGNSASYPLYAENIGSGFGAYIESATGIAAQFISSSLASVSTIAPVINVIRYSTGTPLAGIGAAIDFYVKNDSGSSVYNGSLSAEWYEVVNATRKSRIHITAVNNGSSNIVASFYGNGKVIIPGSLTPDVSLYVLNTTGRALSVSTTTGEAFYAFSETTSYGVARLQKINSINNTDDVMLDIIKGTSGTPTVGIGARIDWYVQSLTGLVNSCKTISRYTNVTAAAESANFEFHLQHGGSLGKRYTISGQGYLLLESITATNASAITPVDGMLVNLSSTNGTFTAVGYWARENGVWVKL